MKALRQFLRVSWTDKRSNEWVLQKAETKCNLLQAIKKRNLSFCGRALRRKLHGEGNYTSYYTRPKTQRKTKDQLA